MFAGLTDEILSRKVNSRSRAAGKWGRNCCWDEKLLQKRRRKETVFPNFTNCISVDEKVLVHIAKQKCFTVLHKRRKPLPTEGFLMNITWLQTTRGKPWLTTIPLIMVHMAHTRPPLPWPSSKWTAARHWVMAQELGAPVLGNWTS